MLCISSFGHAREAIKGSTSGSMEKPSLENRAENIDVGAFLEVNRLRMRISNIGLFAFDTSGTGAGLEFPKGSGKSVIYSSGLWIGGMVRDEIRTAMADFSSEYAPGPLTDGIAATDDTTFRVYRIGRGDGAESRDYREWPVSQGAPVTENGAPLIMGDQMTWTVFNDGDSTRHTHNGGSTPPLGIEIRLTAFAFDRACAPGNTLFMKYTLINGSLNEIENTYISLWCDPDLGGAADDLVGCDAELGLGYCYNATNKDIVYADRPPAVGILLLKGPTADSGEVLAFSSFNKYIGGTDPASALNSYNYMKGMRWDGNAWLNPITREETVLFAPGDPASGIGWLDSHPADRRFMINLGPFTFAPGDSQDVWIAVIAAQGNDRLESIRKLKAYAETAQFVYARDFDFANTPPVSLFSYSPATGGTPYSLRFNPSSTEDAEDEKSALQVRWDWNDDGIWDTNFAPIDTISHAFAFPGMYPVTMQAKDPDGLISVERQYVRVGALSNAWISVTVPADTPRVTLPCEETTVSISFINGAAAPTELQFMELGAVSMHEYITEPPFQRAAGMYLIETPGAASVSAVLSISYADSTLDNANIKEEDLAIITWDSVAGEWGVIPTTVETEVNTVSAEVSHFSLYALVDRTSAIVSAVNGRKFDDSTPQDYRLYQNFPNPFNPTTQIRYEVYVPAHVSLRIYTLSGQLIRQLLDSQREPGAYFIHWDGRNESGIPVSSGIYIYELQAGDFKAARKMVLLR